MSFMRPNAIPATPMQPKLIATTKMQSPNLPGQDVTMTLTQIDDHPVVFEVTATLGTKTYAERHTIGRDDGLGPIMTLPELQAAVDGYRQRVCDALALQESMAQMFRQLK